MNIVFQLFPVSSMRSIIGSVRGGTLPGLRGRAGRRPNGRVEEAL